MIDFYHALLVTATMSMEIFGIVFGILTILGIRLNKIEALLLIIISVEIVRFLILLSFLL